MADNLMFWLEELGKEHVDLVGRKCANLGEMTRLGLRVPPGFALSVNAYRGFMEKSGAADEVRRVVAKYGAVPSALAQADQLSIELRQIVESSAVPPEMASAIGGFYRRLCQRCGGVEVAVSTRSAGPVSHPGQYETYLNVTGEKAVIENVRRVWASTFNARSLAFRRRNQLPLDDDPIGVAVLKMVNARSAGVVFTADPNTGDVSRVTIEVNWGLGESVVSGESLPDVYVLDKANLEVVEKKLGTKLRHVTAAASGVGEIATPPEKRAAFCLSDPEAHEIGRLAKVLEGHFGVPQDVEFAVDADSDFPDSIVLLQARSEVIARQKSAADQIIDLMMDRLSGGSGHRGVGL